MNEESYALTHVPKAVCIFGSARGNLPKEYYTIAEDIAKRAVPLGYATITGAGPGIMQAANKGCYNNNGHSVGIRIELPFEAGTNPYCHEVHNFKKFYSRKCMLVRNADVFVAMPGGFGTLDELFEVLTLSQCEKLKTKRTIILVGHAFWDDLVNFIKVRMQNVTISEKDLDLFTVVDTADEVINILENIG
jgi:uncharacterized protein (TIGR00730 family)